MHFRKYFVSILLTLFFSSNITAKWGTPPDGWNDFKFALIDGNRDPFKKALRNAVNAKIQIDYSYVYITTIGDIKGFLFAPWFNYAKTRPGNLKPSITIYMLQQGQDAPDGSSALKSAADAVYMKKYFEAVAEIADSCKGTNPIFVIEPDVWAYLLGQANQNMTEKNLSKICHINNLGLPWLSEFENRMDNLPGAIIKTLKLSDPNCYAGILMAHWGMPNGVEDAKTDGKLSGKFVSKFLQEPYRGDFIGIEKNGTDAGCWGASSSWHWNETKNTAALAWCKALGIEVDLPIFGWQISTGYQNESGYDPLPDTSGSYTDTYFPYFFKHTMDFINAGFIGFDAGCNNQGKGTWNSLKTGEGDNGWFLNNLKKFNTNRPYNLNLNSEIKSKNLSLPNANFSVKIIHDNLIINSVDMATQEKTKLSIFSPNGRTLIEKRITLSNGICQVYIDNLGAGLYYIKLTNNRVRKCRLIIQ